MKKYFLTGVLFLTLANIHAQKTTPKKTVPVKPVPAKTSAAAPALKTQTDSLSYAIGLSVANFYKQQGMGKLNTNILAKACNDVLSNNKVLLTEDQANLLLMCHSNPQLCENVKTGENYLAQNKKNSKIQSTPSGIQYEVITTGTGIKPAATDTVTVNYKGSLLNGTEFDNSYTRGSPATFALNAVIRGWTEALQLMPVGSKYKLYIPYQLAYGLNDNGPIPGGSLLVFEVELLDVKKAK
jgi:FKBP-type peptidyl-prolyl cis-trans isomerase